MTDTPPSAAAPAAAAAASLPRPVRQLPPPAPRTDRNVLAGVRDDADAIALLQSPKVRDGLAVVLSRSGTASIERFLTMTVAALQRNPALQRCTPNSVVAASLLAAYYGLEPNTSAGLSYLIPRKGRAKIAGSWTDVHECNFEIGYRGYITLAERSGVVLAVKAEAIRHGDVWIYEEGTNPIVRYSKNLLDRGEIIGAFCLTTHPGGTKITSVATRDDILKARAASEAYTSLIADRDSHQHGTKEWARADARLKRTPWVAHEDAMAAKTVIRSHLKALPIYETSARARLLSSAATLDDVASSGALDMTALGGMVLAEPERAKAVIADEADMPVAAASPDDGMGDWVPPEGV